MKNDLKKEKELLALEWPLGFAILINLFALVIIGACVVEEKPEIAIAIFVIGFVTFMIVAAVMLRIEQITGFYKCKKCGHKNTPTYGAIIVAPHIGRTRYLRCSKCGKKSWQKKVL